MVKNTILLLIDRNRFLIVILSMATSKLRECIITTFKLHGFTLQSDASKYLLDILTPIKFEEDRQDRLANIINAINKQPLETTSLDKRVLEDAVKECGPRLDDESQIFSVLNVFQMPKYEYDHSHKKFIERSKLNLPALELFGRADDKANVFRDRYHVIYQRLLRHELFAPLTHDFGQQGSVRRYQLMTIEALLASPTKIENVVTFGMLTQLKEDKLFLEDPTGTVQLDITEANFQSGLYTEGSMCLVEGVFDENVLTATAIGFAPIEPSSNTMASNQFNSSTMEFDNSTYFGAKHSEKLLNLERQREDTMLVFLSDVWLDSPAVLDKLRNLMMGFAESPPFAMIFAGDFLSHHHYGQHEPKVLKDSFKNLADIIQRWPEVANRTHFVFVPSLRDPYLVDILPRPPLTRGIVQPFVSKVSHCHFATNPCRLRYCTQEIVVFRQDIVEKMCRNCVSPPSVGENGKSLEHHFAKTILAQSHLTPLPLHVSPIHWAYDYTLRLYPLPDVIVCCDKYKPYSETMSECIVMNPGSFGKEFSFQVYVPATRHVEDSEIAE